MRHEFTDEQLQLTILDASDQRSIFIRTARELEDIDSSAIQSLRTLLYHLPDQPGAMTDLNHLLDQIDRLDQVTTAGPWEETWKQIPGYDGYEVSDFGNVRSYYLKGNHKKKRAKYPRLIKPDSSSGYPSFYIKSDSGKYLRVTAHILVMRAFVGSCPEGREVAHLNGDSTDPRLVNLKYVTPKENNSHKVAHGTSGHGSKNSRAKLQGWQVEEIKYLAEKSVPQRKIADLFDIKTAQVNDILNERTWAETEARTALPKLAAVIRRLRECAQTLTEDNNDASDYTSGIHEAVECLEHIIKDALGDDDD